MRVTCSNCSTSFEVDDGEIGQTGALVPCPNCGTQVAAMPLSSVLYANASAPVTGSTITLDADELAELAEVEDDALIELDDDETVAEVFAPTSPGEAARPAPSFDIDLPDLTPGRAANPFAAAFDAQDAAEETPPPPLAVRNGDYPLADDDTVVGPHRPARADEGTPEIDVNVSDVELDEAPAPAEPADLPYGQMPTMPGLEPSDPPIDPAAYEVLGTGPTGPDSTLIVRKRRAPKELAALDGEEGGPPERTQPRVQQPHQRGGTGDGETDPGRANVSFSRTRASATQAYLLWGGIVLGVALLAGGFLYWRGLPIAPPEVPNPLEQRADDWRKSGQPLAKVDDAAAAVIEGLASGTNAGRDRALGAARAAVVADPKSPGAVSLYARALAARDEQLDTTTLNDVLAAITSVVGDQPNSPDRPSLETSRAWLLLRAGRVDDAREAAARAVATRADYAPAQVVALAASTALKPEHAAQQLAPYLNTPEVANDARLWLGEAQLANGQVNEAIATWRGGLRDVPTDGAFVGRLARLQADLGDYAAASDLLSQNVARGAASLGDVLTLARLQSRALHKPKTALETLDTAQKERESQPFAVAQLVAERVTVALSVKPALIPADEITKMLAAAAAGSPNVPQLIYAAALAELGANQTQKAIDGLESAQALAPEAPEIAFALAALTKTADHAGASEVVATALKERADYIPLHILDATIAAEHDEKPRAVTAVRKALTFDPALYVQHTMFSAYGEPLSVMLDVARSLAEHSSRLDNTILKSAAGALYVLANDQKNGPLWLTKALRGDPNDVGAHFYSAILNLRRGQKKPARLDLAAAEKSERRQPMVRLYKARVFEQIGKYPEATKIYRDLVDQNPLNAAAFVGLGRVLRIQGDEQAARDAGRKALAVRPRDREALRLLVADASGTRRDATTTRPRR